MLKKVSVICLFLCSVPFSAWADTITEYTINFTTTSGVAPTSGSFTYDSTVQSFANFLVSWGGITFDLTAAADSPILFGTGCTGEAATPAYGFAIMSQDVTGCPVTSYAWGGGLTPTGDTLFFQVITNLSIDEIYTHIGGPLPEGPLGTWTITPTPVPEPSGFVLLSVGLGMIGVLRQAKNRRQKRS